MAHAAAHSKLLTTLAFFLNWPSLAHAERLLIDRQDEVDGDHYEFLAPAADKATCGGLSGASGPIDRVSENH